MEMESYKVISYLSSQVTQWKSDDHVCGLGLLWCVELASVSKHLEVNISAQVQIAGLHVMVVNAKLVCVRDLVYLNRK